MPQFYIDDLFPCYRTSLLCGPSGAGKSHWLLPTIADWLEGKPVFGRQSHPQACGYLSCDRPSDSTHELIDKLGLESRLKNMPIVSLMDGNNTFEYEHIAIKHFPPGQPRVLFIEAFQTLIPDGKITDYWGVLNFFRRWNQFCKQHQYSIFASVHSPKVHEDSSYTQMRDKVMGTVAWAAATETIIVIEPVEPKDLDCSLRAMSVLPRNEKPFKMELDFDERNHLVESFTTLELSVDILDTAIVKHQPGHVFTTAELYALAESKGLSIPTCKRWLQRTGYLRRVDRGRYKLALPQ